MVGTFKGLSGNTITFDDGTKHDVAAGAKVLLNNKPATLGEIQIGDRVSLTGSPATAVDASR